MLLFATASLHGQNGSGVVVLQGTVIDTVNKEPLPFTVVEVTDGGRKLERSMTDLDGRFQLDFCASKCSGELLIVQMIPFGYPDKKVSVECRTDTALVLSVDGPMENIEILTRDSLSRFLDHHSPPDERYPCGYALEDADPLFQHCDGTIRRYSELLRMGTPMVGWKIMDDH
jgi:hypothetical protein